MPTLTDDADRHIIIDKRKGQYTTFPDVCYTNQGRLLVAYRESDSHYPKRAKLLLRSSDDWGDSWSDARVLHASNSHCPRITMLSDSSVIITDDGNNSMFWSMDNGHNWMHHACSGLRKSMYDRIIELDTETFLTTSHDHRGTSPHPVTGQATTEQMVYISENRGQSWRPLAVQGYEKSLVLCEASQIMLPDGRIFALMRENSGVFEPMYATFSEDKGRTWSEPVPTRLIGHRPTIGLTRNGKLLVTYRNVGPNPGTCAWMGSVEDLLTDFMVHGHVGKNVLANCGPNGLTVHSCGGEQGLVRYVMRPLSDPVRGRARLELECRTMESEGEAFCVYFGEWWTIGPNFIRPLAPGARAISFPEKEFTKLEFRYEFGKVEMRVNGRKRKTRMIDMDVNARYCIIGNRSTEKNAGRWQIKSIRHTTDEPRYGRYYALDWDCSQGVPDLCSRKTILELQNCHGAWGGDMGYNGWTQLPDGSFYCTYHTADGRDKHYEKTTTSWVVGTRFFEDDFRV